MKSMYVFVILVFGLALLPTSSRANSVDDALDAAQEALDTARESSPNCYQAISFDLEKVIRSMRRLQGVFTHSRAQRAMRRLENARDEAGDECPSKVVRRIRESLESLKAAIRTTPSVEVIVPVVEYGWDPIYYDGYVIYYNEAGIPFYYVDGMQILVPEHERYYYVDYYHQHRDAYHNWYQRRGNQYQSYRHHDHRSYHSGKPVLRPVDREHEHGLKPVIEHRENEHGLTPVIEHREQERGLKPVVQPYGQEHKMKPVVQPHGQEPKLKPVVEPREHGHDRKPTLKPLNDDDDQGKKKKKHH